MSCIAKILELKGGKEAFVAKEEGDEPWIAVEGGGTYKDHEYLIVLNTMGHRCGYVAIKPGHPYDDDRDYDDMDIGAHGGLTFSSRDHGLKAYIDNPCTDNWIGFDCGHHNDGCDVKAMTKYFGEKYTFRMKTFIDGMRGTVRAYDYVEECCHGIIDQLIEKAS